MATCKECIHYQVCKVVKQNGDDRNLTNSPCKYFIPTSDVVKVKHGEWIEKDCITESNRGRTIHYVTNKCSVCGKWNGRHKSDYCPRCGAKMDGDYASQNTVTPPKTNRKIIEELSDDEWAKAIDEDGFTSLQDRICLDMCPSQDCEPQGLNDCKKCIKRWLQKASE